VRRVPLRTRRRRLRRPVTYAAAVPSVLVVPTLVLVVVALAAWRAERRLRADVAGLDRSAARLSTLRAAVRSLADQVDATSRRHDDLGGR
jgi:hypothetical protein